MRCLLITSVWNVEAIKSLNGEQILVGITTVCSHQLSRLLDFRVLYRKPENDRLLLNESQNKPNINIVAVELNRGKWISLGQVGEAGGMCLTKSSHTKR